MRYYTTDEVAEMLGVTVRSVYNYIEDGRLKAYKIGWTWRFKEEDIEAFVTRVSNHDLQKEKKEG